MLRREKKQFGSRYDPVAVFKSFTAPSGFVKFNYKVLLNSFLHTMNSFCTSIAGLAWHNLFKSLYANLLHISPPPSLVTTPVKSAINSKAWLRVTIVASQILWLGAIVNYLDNSSATDGALLIQHWRKSQWQVPSGYSSLSGILHA